MAEALGRANMCHVSFKLRDEMRATRTVASELLLTGDAGPIGVNDGSEIRTFSRGGIWLPGRFPRQELQQRVMELLNHRRIGGE